MRIKNLKEKRTNTNYNKTKKPQDSEDRFNNIIADNAQRRLEEEEEYIRSQLVQDIEMSMKEEMSIRDLDLVDKMVCILKNIECLQKG